MNNFLQLSDLSNEQISNLIDEALCYKQGDKPLPNLNSDVASIFLEASTRTKISFDLAANKLGNNVVNLDLNTSSLTKGETLYDTLDTLSSLGIKAAIIRSSQERYYQDLLDLDIKIINAGDGAHGHPSQCLLDLTTVYENFNKFSGLKVLIMGDIKHSRVARSNIDMMQRMDMQVDVYAPEIFKTDDDFNYIEDLDNNIANYDIVMLLRNQLERHASEVENIQDTYLEAYGLSTTRLAKLKDDAIIMHPGPFNRDVEIASEVLKDPRNKINDQVTNGLYSRMAIINYVLGDDVSN